MACEEGAKAMTDTPAKQTTDLRKDASLRGDVLPVVRHGKKAKDSDAAFKAGEDYSGKPHGWIQWKGTSVCMDVYCACGYHSHIDAEFAYHVECPVCRRVYACNGHIELIELETRPENCVVTDSGEIDDEEFFSDGKTPAGT